MKNKSDSTPLASTPAALFDTETWVFDLDNTLYHGKYGLFNQVDKRLKEYISKVLNVDEDEAHRVQKHYFRTYGTSLRGMMINHQIDPNPYLDYVHDIDVSGIPADPVLDDALSRLPGRKLIFTNADLGHSHRVLERLQISQHFDGIFDIRDANFVPKPDPQIYDLFAQKFDMDPKKAVMVEDIARNLEPAAGLGMGTIWVKPSTECEVASAPPDGNYVDFETSDIGPWLTKLCDDAQS